jgi:hypothetical protein
MAFFDFSHLTNRALLELAADHIPSILRERGILRTFNNVVADYAEHLACRALGLKQQPASAKGYDATDEATGARYEIKSRRVRSVDAQRRLGAIRNLKSFDCLVVILFERDFSIHTGAVVPACILLETSRFYAHTNSWIVMASDDLLRHTLAINITERLRQAAAELETG